MTLRRTNAVISDTIWSIPQPNMRTLFNAKTAWVGGSQSNRYIGGGSFKEVKGWLTENVYGYGNLYDPEDLVKHVAGKPLQVKLFVDYLEKKFQALYMATSSFYPTLSGCPRAHPGLSCPGPLTRTSP